MPSFLGHACVFLATRATDLRKCFDTLAGVVRNSLLLDPLSGQRFVFANARRNRLRILFWDRNGWRLCPGRLESGSLAWPASDAPAMGLITGEITLLLGGIDVAATQRRPWLDRKPNPTVRDFTAIGAIDGFGMIYSLLVKTLWSGLDPAMWIAEVP